MRQATAQERLRYLQTQYPTLEALACKLWTNAFMECVAAKRAVSIFNHPYLPGKIMMFYQGI